MSRARIFLLSPAFLGGRLGRALLEGRSATPVAARLAQGDATLGEVFAFVSRLYFRGKLEYARAFARSGPWGSGVLVITSTRGLAEPGTPVGTAGLGELAAVDIDLKVAEYRDSFTRGVRALAAAVPEAEVVLLGSVASGKYVDVLLEELGERLLFPVEFVGRGDMSRGAILLRAAEAGVELAYQPVIGAVRRGPRPPRVAPRR